MATLLTVVGEEAREVFATFTDCAEGDDEKIASVLEKFAAYCKPRKSVPFERYCFNKRAQESGEPYEQYVQHCENLLRVANSETSHLMKYCVTVWYLEYRMIR